MAWMVGGRNEQIQRRREAGESAAALAQEYGVSRNRIYEIAKLGPLTPAERWARQRERLRRADERHVGGGLINVAAYRAAVQALQNTIGGSEEPEREAREGSGG